MPGIVVVLVPVTPFPAAICPGELQTAERADLLAGLGEYYGELVVCHLRDPLRHCRPCAWPGGPGVVVAAVPVAGRGRMTSLRPQGAPPRAPLRLTRTQWILAGRATVGHLATLRRERCRRARRSEHAKGIGAAENFRGSPAAARSVNRMPAVPARRKTAHPPSSCGGPFPAGRQGMPQFGRGRGDRR